MIQIIEVKTRKEQKLFVNFPLKLYKNNPYYVPCLYGDEMKLFTSKNPYVEVSKSIFFIAKKEGKVVGRIQGIIQLQYNEIHNEKRMRFTRFDSIDDQEVANALFEAAEGWGKSQGMDTICGPLGYSDLEREGLLIQGFDQTQTFEEQYNYEYYPKLIEGYGFEKEVDWLEFRLRRPKEDKVIIRKIEERAMKELNLHYVSKKGTKRQYINRIKQGFFDVLDETYKHLYGVVPSNEKVKRDLLNQFMPVLNKDFITCVADKNERIVAFGLCFPAIGPSIQKSGGHLYPIALCKLLHTVKHPKVMDLGLVGLLPEYQNSGVSAMIYTYIMSLFDKGIEYCETNLNLEYNDKIMANWKYFDSVNHKRRRSYLKKI